MKHGLKKKKTQLKAKRTGGVALQLAEHLPSKYKAWSSMKKEKGEGEGEERDREKRGGEGRKRRRRCF
jgi:hypothetical protein